MRRLPPGRKSSASQDLPCPNGTGLRRLPHAAGDRRSEHELQKSLDRNLLEGRRAEAFEVNAIFHSERFRPSESVSEPGTYSFFFFFPDWSGPKVRLSRD